MFQFISDKIRKDAKRKALQNVNGEGIISADGKLAFVMDTSRKVMVVVNENNQFKEYSKHDILEIKIEDENEKGYKRSLFSTLVWYEIGKMIDSKGGLQKVLSGWVTEKEIVTVKKIFLRLVVKDFQTPYYDFIFYEKGLIANKKECYELALRWYSLINVLKHQ
jgi:hypothetical protein